MVDGDTSGADEGIDVPEVVGGEPDSWIVIDCYFTVSGVDLEFEITQEQGRK